MRHPKEAQPQQSGVIKRFVLPNFLFSLIWFTKIILQKNRLFGEAAGNRGLPRDEEQSDEFFRGLPRDEEQSDEFFRGCGHGTQFKLGFGKNFRQLNRFKTAFEKNQRNFEANLGARSSSEILLFQLKCCLLL